MRTLVGVALVTVCLGLAGCSLFGKKQTAQKDNNNSKPFLGTESPAKAETTSLPRSSNGPLPGANGLLAGRVVSEATGRPIEAVIRVINLEDDDPKAAPLDVWANQSGYFTISGLKVGGQYELIARAKDGGDLMSRMVVEKPPKATVYLEIDKRWTTPRTPPLPDDPKPLEKKGAAGADKSSEQTSAVGIGPPVKLPDQDTPPRVNLNTPLPDNGAATPAGANAPNPANIADGGFHRLRPPSETVTIPNPPPLPQPPQWQNVPNDPQTQGAPAPPGSPGSVRLPSMPTKVPSCVLVGDRLHNFALYNVDGHVWEYQRNKNKNGRLMLLDFWHHQCPYCLTGMREHLVKWQRDYGPYGLEVIGIACERGPVEQQREAVLSVRGRCSINYPTLLSGGSNSPILTQFGVHYFPLLILLDEKGNILWHSSDKGMDDYAYESLRRMINNRLIKQTPP